MKNDKILNFMIAMFLTIIIFNLFLPKQKQEAVTQNVVLKSTENDYTTPNLPVLQVINNTAKRVTFDTCKDVSITKDSKKIDNIAVNAPKFCTSAYVEPNTTFTINIDWLSKLFSNSWDYIFSAKISWQDYQTVFKVSEKGFFNNLFSHMFYAPVYNLFVLLINVLPGHNLWLAIILVTLIIRLIVLVPQHRIMVNSKKMQAIQPKIKEIQEKYKWDQAKIWMELLEIYKKEKVNPMWSCLPLLIQLPLLIVLYWVISGITSPANYYYLYPTFANFNISSINLHFLGLNLIQNEWKSGLILAILIWASQWLQIKMSLLVHEKKKDHGKIVEKEVKIDDPVSEFMPDPNMMNWFMLWWMPTMLAVSSYFFPAWVSIYWLIWTIFTLIQQYVVNKVTDKSKNLTTEWHEIIIKEKKKK